jgi:CelD/BcsL family acetyltransferase involved in cellulose biosynthesis
VRHTRGAGRLRLRPGTDERAWDAQVRAHPDGTAFHLAGFLRTAAPLLGCRLHLTVAEADGQVVGGVPLLVRSAGPGVLVNHAVPFPYLGPLLTPEFSPDAVGAAVRAYLRPRPVVHLGLQALSPQTLRGTRGWVHKDGWRSAVVPVAGQDDDALLARLSRQQRGKVRRALELGLEAGPATREEIAALTPWAAETLARQGLPPHWRAGAHVRLYDALSAAGTASATAVRREGKLLAVSLDAVLGDLMIGWEMGMDEEGRRAGASLVLHVANMRRARDSGAAEFDMLGTPTPGIAHYKRSLGAQLRPRGVAHWEPGWLPPRRHLRRAAALLGRRGGPRKA